MPDSSEVYNQHLNAQDQPESNPEKEMDEEFNSFTEIKKDSRLVDPDHNGHASRAHELNLELIDIIKYRNSKKWMLSFLLVCILFTIIFLMLIFVAMGKDITEGWKEVLFVLLGAFVSSFSKLIDFWFNNQEAENALLKAAQDVNGNGIK